MRIHIRAIALSCGIVLGIFVFVTTLQGIYFGFAIEFLEVLRSVYPGYSISLVGSFVGLIYGFVDGAVAAGIIAWIYNRILVKM